MFRKVVTIRGNAITKLHGNSVSVKPVPQTQVVEPVSINTQAVPLEEHSEIKKREHPFLNFFEKSCVLRSVK